MHTRVTLIGFGEAAQAFCADASWRGDARTYDRKTDIADQRAGKLADYARLGVTGSPTLNEALAGAPLVLSLVTADEALQVARNASPALERGALLLDMNSVSPDTKRAAASAVVAAGASYTDVAIMAPVHPARTAVELLISGTDSPQAKTALEQLGFSNVRIVGSEAGRASSIKMIRSVMVKGMEALTAECLMAAQAAGVVDEVTASLGPHWPERANYYLERMLVHGNRRAAEMEEACATLESLGIAPELSRGTVRQQRRLGALRLTPVPATLDAKLRSIAVDAGVTSK